jgi:3-oxoacyl-[acyl-carrier protein] reductase
MAEKIPTCVVVGATGGIGTALCRRLAQRRTNLLIAAREEGRLTALAQELGTLGSRVRSYPLDATRSDDVNAAVAAAVTEFGRIDGAVNLVGSILLKPAHLTTDAEFEQTLTLNTRTAFYLLRAAAKVMMESGGGSIVLVSTVAASIGLPNHEAIAAAKAAINGLVRSAAATYAGRGIRVNGVAPGLVRTPLASKITSNELALKASIGMHPLGRIGEPDDIASALEWLLDPANNWVTGQMLGIDGGLSTVRGK